MPAPEGHPLDPISSKDAIGGDDRTLFLQRLGCEQAVERITVVERERRDACHMLEFERELSKIVDRELLRYEPIDDAGKLELAEADLDRDFPAARQAHQALVRGVSDRLPRLRRQSFRIVDPPQEYVGVDQDAHQT